MENEEGRLQRLEELAQARGRALQEEFQKKVNSLKDRIGVLQSEKLGILKGRISKAEAIALMKQDLKTGREQFVMEFTRANLASYQSQYRSLKNIDHLALHQFQKPGAVMGFLYSWISESMIDQAGEMLEHDGPTAKERQTKIDVLEKEIEKLTRELEGLLK